MNKLSIIAQWLLVAAVAAFVAYVLVRPVPQPDYAPAAWHDWSGVTVLSYAGIARSDTPVYPTVKRLEAHLTALRDAGYRTVRPEDVRAFLDERAPLPPKALLLLFEGGRKEAFIRATPVLQRTGFSAVIAVPTTVMDQWGGFYLKRGDLRKVARLPQWDVGSMGHDAIHPVPGGSEQERFLATRLRAGGNEESADAFRERVLGDYARSARALCEASGKPPLLYLYPYGEAGQSPGADPLAAEANRDAVTRHFALAFIGGSNAFNGAGSDPWSLSRLRVPGDWPAERLVSELAASWPRARAQAGLGSPQDWILEREATLGSERLSLPLGSVAWLRGSDAWADVEVSADLLPAPAATASLYARYANARSWVRVTADADGLRVQERLGSRLYTLHSHGFDSPTRAARHVRLRLRNNRAWVWLDGQPVAENLPLAPATRRGRVGVGSERGSSSLSAFAARPLSSRWVLANSLRLIPDEKQDDVQAVLPNWFRAGEPASVAQTAQQELLRAAVAGIRTIPLLTGGAALDAAAASRWAEAIDAELTRTNLKPLTPVVAVDGPASRLAEALRDRSFRVAHLLSPAQALQWGRSIAQASPDETLVVNVSGPDADEAVAWLTHAVPASRVYVRDASGAFGPGLATLRRVETELPDNAFRTSVKEGGHHE